MSEAKSGGAVSTFTIIGTTDASGNAQAVTAALPVPSAPPTSSSVTHANVASSATVVTLQALNASRKGWNVFNDSTSVLDVKFGSAASATSFTVEIAAGGYYEMPYPIYTGVITGIWDTANGSARVSEL